MDSPDSDDSREEDFYHDEDQLTKPEMNDQEQLPSFGMQVKPVISSLPPGMNNDLGGSYNQKVNKALQIRTQPVTDATRNTTLDKEQLQYMTGGFSPLVSSENRLKVGIPLQSQLSADQTSAKSPNGLSDDPRRQNTHTYGENASSKLSYLDRISGNQQ